MKRELARLEAEAGIADESDPATPSGDLKHDIESFTTLDACTRARSTTDPVLGDAIDSIGYTTLASDACRLLEAMRMKDKTACKPIASSSLRTRCESNVAILVGNPSLCPLTAGDARDPLCIARAARDVRFCAAELSFQRSQCVAMVTGHSDDCHRDLSCARQVQRYKSLLEMPAEHKPFSSHLHVEITPEPKTPDPPVRSFDFAEEAGAGAVIKAVGDRTRITLGGKTAYWPSSDAPYAQPRIFIELVRTQLGPSKSRVTLTPAELTLELLLPKVGTFSALTSDERTLEISRWSDHVGETLNLTITAKLNDAPRSYRAKIEVETFVRDVVDSAAVNEHEQR